jgi:hypothetical protein
MQLEEKREHALINIQKRQEVVKKYFDRGATTKIFAKINLSYCGIRPKKNLHYTQSLMPYGLDLTILKIFVVSIHIC